MNRIDHLREIILHPIPPCPAEWQATKGVQGAITGALNKALSQPGCTPEQANAWRRMVLAYLFGNGQTAISSHALTRAQWYALYQWIGYWHDPVEGWLRRPEFPTEAGIVLAYVLHAEQLKMEALLCQTEG